MKRNSSIPENPREYSSLQHILNELPNDNEWVIIQLRKDAEGSIAKNKDAGTAELAFSIFGTYLN